MRRLVLPAAGLCGLALAVVPALAADQTVSTSGSSFTPANVAVKPGEKVTIHNGGMGYHSLYWADDTPGQPTARFDDWETERTFTAAGEFVFYCGVHGSASGGMRGTVFVNDAGTVPSGGGTTTTPTTTTGTGGGGSGGGTTTTGPPPGGGGTTTGTTTEPAPGGGSPGEADTAAPDVELVRRSANRRRVKVRVEVSEGATITLRLVRRGVRLARRTYEVQEGEVTLRLRRALSRGRYRIRLTVEDEAGNSSKLSLRARVR